MNIALVTGSAGLIGSESVAFFADKFDLVVGHRPAWHWTFDLKQTFAQIHDSMVARLALAK